MSNNNTANYFIYLVLFLSGVVVGSRTRDGQIAGSIPGRGIVGQRPWAWASCSHQCASVYQGLSCRHAVCGSHGMKSNEQGEYCRSGSAAY